jgi:hypothetical protein
LYLRWLSTYPCLLKPAGPMKFFRLLKATNAESSVPEPLPYRKKPGHTPPCRCTKTRRNPTSPYRKTPCITCAVLSPDLGSR